MTSRSIAVVGSGPSGLYAADALVRLDPEATIHIYERLPTPFGLIRFGVAPDHPGTKAVTRQFDRLMARPNLRFLGNVEVGRNPDLDELQAAYDLVIMATGAPRDRRMDIEGDEPGQIYGSAAITGWYNGHPDHSDETPVIGRRVTIFGMGNVAIDIARILLKPRDELAHTDMPPAVVAALRDCLPDEVSLVARRGPEHASFTPTELAALAALPGLSVHIGGTIPDNAGDTLIEKRLDLLRSLKGTGTGGDRRLNLLFGRQPAVVRRSHHGQVVQLQNSATNQQEEHLADTLISAIGYECQDLPGIRTEDGRILSDGSGRVARGVYAVGWCRRGSNGTIPTNRQEAQAVVKAALASPDLTAGKSPSQLIARLEQSSAPIVDWAAWKRIEAIERGDGCMPGKLATWVELLDAAK